MSLPRPLSLSPRIKGRQNRESRAKSNGERASAKPVTSSIMRSIYKSISHLGFCAVPEGVRESTKIRGIRYRGHPHITDRNYSSILWTRARQRISQVVTFPDRTLPRPRSHPTLRPQTDSGSPEHEKHTLTRISFREPNRGILKSS